MMTHNDMKNINIINAKTVSVQTHLILQYALSLKKRTCSYRKQGKLYSVSILSLITVLRFLIITSSNDIAEEVQKLYAIG